LSENLGVINKKNCPPFYKGGGPLAVEDFYQIKVCPFQGEMSLATKGLKSLSASPYPPLKRGNKKRDEKIPTPTSRGAPFSKGAKNLIIPPL